MSLNAPSRSALGAYLRSTLGARAYRGPSGPTPPGDCWALDVGAMTVVNDRAAWNLGICGGGTTSGQLYRNSAQLDLTCVVRDCEQTGYRVRGRTSGHEQYMGVLEKIPITGDCDTACAVDVGGGQYNVANRGFWWTVPDPDVWLVGTNAYTTGSQGFQASERCDLLITACWENPLLSVAPDATFPTLPLMTVQDTHALLDGMRISISGSTHYDGSWQVGYIRSPTSFVLVGGGISYLGDDTGTVHPHYDYKP